MTKKRVLSALLALCLLLAMFPLAAGAAEGDAGAGDKKVITVALSDAAQKSGVSKAYNGKQELKDSEISWSGLTFRDGKTGEELYLYNQDPPIEYTAAGAFEEITVGENKKGKITVTLTDKTFESYSFEGNEKSHEISFENGKIEPAVLSLKTNTALTRKYDGTTDFSLEGQELTVDTDDVVSGEKVSLTEAFKDALQKHATATVKSSPLTEGDAGTPGDVGEYSRVQWSRYGAGIPEFSGTILEGENANNYQICTTFGNLVLLENAKITQADRTLTAALSVADLTPNKTAQVTVTADNAKNQPDFAGKGDKYTYASGKSDVVEVAEDGTVTAKTKGEATITVNAPATKNYAAGTQTVNVVVKGIPVTLTINATVKDVEVAPEPEPEPNPEPPESNGGEGGTGGEEGSTDGGDGGADTPLETNADAPTTKKVVTLTVTANPADVLSNVTVAADNGLVVTKADGKTNEWTADLPTSGDAKTYTFTASYAGDTTHESATATCQVKSDGTVVQPEKPPVTPPSGGNTGGTTTPPAPTPVEEISKTPTVSGGTANATVSSSEGAGLVAEAQKPTTGEVSVKVKPNGSADTVNVSLPASTAAGIGAAKTDLVVETPLAIVTLPSESLTDLGAGANQVTVSASRPAGSEALTITIAKDGKAVDSLPGNVKVALPFAGAGKGTVAVLVNPDGTESVIKKSIARDEEMVMVLEGSASVKIKDNTKSFDDTANHWAGNDGSIDFVSSRELFKGTSDTSFSPEQTMTRGMIVTVLHRLENTPKGNAPAFGDVQSSDYYAEAVAWGAQNGIVTGTGNNNFAPGQDVSREQLAAFLYRYANAYGIDTSSRSSLNGFGDSANVSAYAKDAMEWCVGAGLIKGTGNNSLSPNGNAKRGEVAAILMRFVEYINQ